MATILHAHSYDDAVRIANDTPFGLSSSIYTSDLRRSMEFAEDLVAGVVKVNRGTAGLELHVPFGGTRESGFGSSEQGKSAVEFYTQWKTVYLEGVYPG